MFVTLLLQTCIRHTKYTFSGCRGGGVGGWRRRREDEEGREGEREGAGGGLGRKEPLSYVKQACGCPLLCGVRTLFSGQFEHASPASRAAAPLTHYTEPQQKLENVASSFSVQTPSPPPFLPPSSLLYSQQPPRPAPPSTPTPLRTRTPMCQSNGARQTSVLN